MKKIIVIGVLLVIISVSFVFWLTEDLSVSDLIEVEYPQKRNIRQAVYASGSIQAINQIKVGSLVTGIIDKLLIQENQTVEKGQLLAEIDTGKADTEVNEAQGQLETRLAELDFFKNEYERKKSLYQNHHVSLSDFENAVKNYSTATFNAGSADARLERTKIAYANNNIYAPGTGIITSVGVAKGERITTDLDATVLCEIAPDVTKMEAILNISEGNIGIIKMNLPVRIIVDAFPDHEYTSQIGDISFSQKKTKAGYFTYQAKAEVHNPDLILHPGMNLTAVVEVSSAESVISVTSRAFLIRYNEIQEIGKFINFDVVPLSPKKRKELSKIRDGKKIHSVWVVEEERFVEVPVELGTNDGIFYEIKSGLNENQAVVVGIPEEDKMKELYQKLYRKSLR